MNKIISMEKINKGVYTPMIFGIFLFILFGVLFVSEKKLENSNTISIQEYDQAEQSDESVDIAKLIFADDESNFLEWENNYFF